MKVNEKYFANLNDDRPQSIDSVLAENESVLWRGKPKKSAYILSAVFKMLPLALLWLAFDGAFIGVFLSTAVVDGGLPIGVFIFVLAFFAFHLMPVWIWLGNIIKSGRELKNIEYAITDKRIIIKSGFIGVDYKFIHFQEIVDVNAKVGLTDKICKVGDIYITANDKASVIFDQENPISLASEIQRLVNDIKTDISYPNALRPSSNPGYNTKLDD